MNFNFGDTDPWPCPYPCQRHDARERADSEQGEREKAAENLAEVDTAEEGAGLEEQPPEYPRKAQAEPTEAPEPVAVAATAERPEEEAESEAGTYSPAWAVAA